MRTDLFSESERQYVRDNYPTMLSWQIAENLGRTKSSVKNLAMRMGLRLPPEERERRYNESLFKKGRISWNKGLALPNVPNSGQFEKGRLPHNTKHDGAISLRTHAKRKNSSYLWIRIGKGKWEELHRHNWTKKNGAIPRGGILRFKDGNHLNCAVDNLELIDRRKHLDKNRNYTNDRMGFDKIIAGYITRDKELKKDIIENHPELISAKREQLKLRRQLNEIRRTA